MIRHAFHSRERRSIRQASAGDRAIGGMPGGQGCPAVAGTGASPVENRKSASVTAGGCGSRRLSGTDSGAGGRTTAPDREDWMAMALTWASAVRAVCRQRASQVSAWHWSQPNASFPVLKVVSIGHS